MSETTNVAILAEEPQVHEQIREFSLLSEKKLEGFIDMYQRGIVFGWAWCPDLPEESLKIALRNQRGEILGTGVANLWRDDLKKANIGTGQYGFQVKISFPQKAEKIMMKLVEYETGRILSKSPFTVAFEAPIRVSFHRMEWGTLYGEIISSYKMSDPVNLRILDENHECFDTGQAKMTEEGKYAFSIPIPTRFFDGCIHAVTVQIAGEEVGEATFIDLFPSSFTPWEYLANSAMELNTSALSRTSGYRYSSMRKQLAADSNLDPVTFSKKIAAVTQAHNVIVEGWEERTRFPQLKLPFFENPEVSIIIPVHNKFELTYHCLASIALAWNCASYEVIVIDDCSTDTTLQIGEYVENVRYLFNEDNLGFLRSCNKAAAAARGKYLVMLNNDTEVTSGWLDEQISIFNRFENVGMTGSKLIYPNGLLQEAGGIVWGSGEPWNLGNRQNAQAPEWNYVRQVDYLSGASLMVPVEIWNQVGGFSDEFAPAYYEDTDLAFKIREMGYKTVYVPHSVVVHFEGMSNGRDISKGIKRFQDVNSRKFRAKWIDIYQGNGEASQAAVPRNKDRNVTYRVLMIDYAIPRPDQDAGSFAALQEIRMLQANGCKVSFVADNLAYMGKYTERLHRMGVETFYAPFSTSVEQILEQRGKEFDIVYITRYDIAEHHLPAVRKHTTAKVLFNNADLHFLREIRAHLNKRSKDLSGPLATRDRELELMRNVDGILSYSPTEHAVIISHNLKADNLFICPWVLDGRGHKTPFKERSGIAFLGGFRHFPNVEAVEFFVDKVMPLLRERLANVAFHVYGSNMPAEFEKMAAPDVILEGFVENLDDVFEHRRVLVSPLLSGAGIKGKVLEAVSTGVPQVLSPIAAEATGLTHSVSAMIAEDPEEWVDMIAELYESENRWRQISENSLALAKSSYSFENGVKGMRKALEGLQVFPPKRIGALVAK